MLELVTPPTAAPVQLENVKQHLRISTDIENSYLLDLIELAMVEIRRRTAFVMMAQTWDLFLKTWPAGSEIKIPLAPLDSIVGVFYTLDGDTETEFSATNYNVDAVSVPGRIVLKSTADWPGGTLETSNAIRIRFVAGVEQSNDVDRRLIQALYLICSHYYENREPVLVDRGVSVVPLGTIDDLLADFRSKMWEF